MHDDTDKPPRLAFTVTSARVQHYGDVVEHLVATAVRKASEEGWRPTQAEIDFFRREVTRYAVIRRDVETATKLKLKKQTILND